MSKVVVIGAGASGIIASLKLSKNNEVILIDKNNKIGKKILLTGNGRCNYFNSDIALKNYNTDSVDKLDKIIKHKHETLAYLDDLGIYPRVKNGYYYPNSMQASSIVSIFNSAIEKSNIKVLLECEVLDIIKNNDFLVKTTTGDIVCDKVVVACGGCSYPKTGSDGSIFNIYHTIINCIAILHSCIGGYMLKGQSHKDGDGDMVMWNKFYFGFIAGLICAGLLAFGCTMFIH